MSQGTNVQRFGIHFEWLSAGNTSKVFTAVCNVFRLKSDKKVKRRGGGMGGGEARGLERDKQK
jgi:hypothetical protein